MDPHVGIQVANLSEVLPTDPAGVWFLPSVYSLVDIQMLAHGEFFATHVAGVNSGFPARVAFDVSLQNCVFNKSLPTELTNVRPLTSMQLQVPLQRTFPGEVLATVFASERLLASMCPHVDLHVPKADATDVADPAGFSVTLDVKLQTL